MDSPKLAPQSLIDANTQQVVTKFYELMFLYLYLSKCFRLRETPHLDLDTVQKLLDILATIKGECDLINHSINQNINNIHFGAISEYLLTRDDLINQIDRLITDLTALQHKLTPKQDNSK